MRRPTPLVTSLLALMLVTVACRRERPEVPDVPAGPRWALRGDTAAFTTVGCAPRNDVVSYRFDWGDGDTSAWTDWYDGGQRSKVLHIWGRDGLFEVRAQARDRRDQCSDWSEPCTLAVVPMRPGTLKWTYESWQRLWSMPAIGRDGALYFSEGTGITALDPDGSTRWNRDLDAQVLGPVALAPDGAVCFFAEDGSLGMLEPDGALRWRVDVRGYESRASPAIQADGSVCIGTNDGNLQAFGPDARVKWSVVVAGDALASPSISQDRTIYFCTGSRDRAVYAVEPDGSVRWRFQADDGIRVAPAVGADGRIYALDVWWRLYALRSDGTPVWCTDLDPGVYCYYPSVVIGPGEVIYILTDYSLCAVRRNGRILWEYETDDYTSGAPAVAADGSVCFTAGYPSVLHVVAPDGRLEWQYADIGWISSSPTIGPDGTVYLVSNRGSDGALLAIQGTAPLADSPWPKHKRDIANTGRARP